MALILSGGLPELGQFGLRAWGKGGVFLVAGLAAAWALGRPISVQDLRLGLLPHPRWAVGTLPAVFPWSVIDARTSAR